MDIIYFRTIRKILLIYFWNVLFFLNKFNGHINLNYRIDFMFVDGLLGISSKNNLHSTTDCCLIPRVSDFYEPL